MRRLVFLGVVVVLLGGVAALGPTVSAQPDPCADDVAACREIIDDGGGPEPVDDLGSGMGESVFGAGATAELLAAGAIPVAPPQPAALALQRVRLAPGAHIVTPANDPRVVLLYVERGTLTVRNTVDATVTRATPDAWEAVPAETEFTMSAGDSSLSPAGSGGELRNDGTEEVSLLAGIIIPLPAGTPVAGTPVP